MPAVAFLQVLLSARQRVCGFVLLLQEDEVPSRLRAARHSTVTAAIGFLNCPHPHQQYHSIRLHPFIGCIAGSRASVESFCLKGKWATAETAMVRECARAQRQSILTMAAGGGQQARVVQLSSAAAEARRTPKELEGYRQCHVTCRRRVNTVETRWSLS
jgi:hypothetical protein